jgi:hypothetical protein
VRWASAAAYPSVSPFSSRISPGLHLFYTPRPNRPPYVESVRSPPPTLNSHPQAIFSAGCFERHSDRA